MGRGGQPRPERLLSQGLVMSVRKKQEHQGQSFDWILWLKWILVTTLGWSIGVALGIELLIGAVVGTLQWLVLRPLIRDDGWWIPASAIGWAGAAVGIGFAQPEDRLVGQVVIATGIGLGQWLVLRWQVHRAWWWIVLSTLGWALGMMGMLGVSLAGTVAGSVTGFGLELLLRHRRSSTSATNDREHVGC